MRQSEILLCIVVITLVVFLVWKVWSLKDCKSCRQFIESGAPSKDYSIRREILASFCSDQTMVEIDRFVATFGKNWDTVVGIKNYTDLHAQMDTQKRMEIELYCYGLGDKENFVKWYSLFHSLYPNSFFDINLVKTKTDFISFEMSAYLSGPPTISKLNLYELIDQPDMEPRGVERTLTSTSFNYRGAAIMSVSTKDVSRIIKACNVLDADSNFVISVLSSYRSANVATIAAKQGNLGIYPTNPGSSVIGQFVEKYLYPRELVVYIQSHLDNDALSNSSEIALYFPQGLKDFNPMRTALYFSLSYTR